MSHAGRVAILASRHSARLELTRRIESLGFEAKPFDTSERIVAECSRLRLDGAVLDARDPADPNARVDVIERLAAAGLAPVVIACADSQVAARALRGGAAACVWTGEARALASAVVGALTRVGRNPSARAALETASYEPNRTASKREGQRRLPCPSPNFA